MHLPQRAQTDEQGRIDAIQQALASRIRGEVRFDRHDRLLYSTDASLYQVEPLGVVVPRDAADVLATVQCCGEFQLPLLARGGGTSLSGQTVNRAVVLDCSAWMTGIDVDLENGVLVVEPGAVLDDVNRALASTPLAFGPEVSSSAQATIGGMIANCSAGLHSLVYGMTDEHVLSLDVVLPDGSTVHLAEGASETDPVVADLTHRVAEIVSESAALIDARFPATRRNVGGYALGTMLRQLRASTPGTYDRMNLAQLVTGSEGTLGLVTSARLRLVPRPARTGLAVLGFSDVHSAMQYVTKILAAGPSAVELLDATVIDAAAAHTQYRELLELLPEIDGRTAPVVLYVDFFADDEASLISSLDGLKRSVPDAVFVACTDDASQQRLWFLRKVSLGLIAGSRGDEKPVGMLEDMAVPPESLCQFQQDIDALLGRHGLEATWYAHASVGLLHIRPRMNLRDRANHDLLRTIGLEAVEIVRGYGGTVSGEHGDGRIRREMVNAFYGPELVEVFRRIKAIFDPAGMLNPGIIVGEPGPMQDLRLFPGGHPLGAEVEDTCFDWSQEGGLAAASEACNGNGLCRRSGTGAMCPSYRATRDERHATRGRGNALRLAITGQFVGDGTPDFDDADTMETLDLCLGCKACRYECPSHVDVTKLKAEYEAQRFRSGRRVSLGDRLVGHVRTINRLGSLMAPVANALQATPPFSWIVRRMLDVAPRRTLPTFSRSIHGWMRRRPVNEDAPVVFLLPDCFTTYGETGIARSAVELLEAFGYRVVLPEMGCCGRTRCSTGMLDAARRTIERSAAALMRAIAAHEPVAVLGTEPSCVTTLQQEWVELNTDVAVADRNRIAAMTSTVEHFIVAAWDRHPRRPDFSTNASSLPLHVHCHQKPDGQTIAEFLRRCGWPGVQLLDSGCCGMAGSFGYHARHYDLSMQIAEQSLGPALGDSGTGPVAANGTSCRHQIHDAFARGSSHPVELAIQQLVPGGGGA